MMGQTGQTEGRELEEKWVGGLTQISKKMCNFVSLTSTSKEIDTATAGGAELCN